MHLNLSQEQAVKLKLEYLSLAKYQKRMAITILAAIQTYQEEDLSPKGTKNTENQLKEVSGILSERMSASRSGFGERGRLGLQRLAI